MDEPPIPRAEELLWCSLTGGSSQRICPEGCVMRTTTTTAYSDYYHYHRYFLICPSPVTGLAKAGSTGSSPAGWESAQSISSRLRTRAACCASSPIIISCSSSKYTIKFLQGCLAFFFWNSIRMRATCSNRKAQCNDVVNSEFLIAASIATSTRMPHLLHSINMCTCMLKLSIQGFITT